MVNGSRSVRSTRSSGDTRAASTISSLRRRGKFRQLGRARIGAGETGRQRRFRLGSRVASGIAEGRLRTGRRFGDIEQSLLRQLTPSDRARIQALDIRLSGPTTKTATVTQTVKQAAPSPPPVLTPTVQPLAPTVRSTRAPTGFDVESVSVSPGGTEFGRVTAPTRGRRGTFSGVTERFGEGLRRANVAASRFTPVGRLFSFQAERTQEVLRRHDVQRRVPSPIRTGLAVTGGALEQIGQRPVTQAALGLAGAGLGAGVTIGGRAVGAALVGTRFAGPLAVGARVSRVVLPAVAIGAETVRITGAPPIFGLPGVEGVPAGQRAAEVGRTGVRGSAFLAGGFVGTQVGARPQPRIETTVSRVEAIQTGRGVRGIGVGAARVDGREIPFEAAFGIRQRGRSLTGLVDIALQQRRSIQLARLQVTGTQRGGTVLTTQTGFIRPPGQAATAPVTGARAIRAAQIIRQQPGGLRSESLAFQLPSGQRVPPAPRIGLTEVLQARPTTLGRQQFVETPSAVGRRLVGPSVTRRIRDVLIIGRGARAPRQPSTPFPTGPRPGPVRPLPTVTTRPPPAPSIPSSQFGATTTAQAGSSGLQTQLLARTSQVAPPRPAPSVPIDIPAQVEAAIRASTPSRSAGPITGIIRPLGRTREQPPLITSVTRTGVIDIQRPRAATVLRPTRERLLSRERLLPPSVEPILDTGPITRTRAGTSLSFQPIQAPIQIPIQQPIQAPIQRPIQEPFPPPTPPAPFFQTPVTRIDIVGVPIPLRFPGRQRARRQTVAQFKIQEKAFTPDLVAIDQGIKATEASIRRDFPGLRVTGLERRPIPIPSKPRKKKKKKRISASRRRRL